jgi:subtilisin family serine protease
LEIIVETRTTTPIFLDASYTDFTGLWEPYPDDDLYFSTDPQPYALDDQGHGTHVAGIVAAETNNGVGVAGVAPNAVVMPLKASAGPFFTTEDWLEALQYAVANGARVVNMSFGGYEYSSVEQSAIQAAFESGVILVAASGNDNTAQVIYPAAYDGAIAVGAIDETGMRASFSNYGTKLDLVAPGDRILSCVPEYLSDFFGGSYAYFSGTSMASPMVAGVAALCLGIQPALSA